MFMFMLRLSAGALSVSACALSVRRAQRPRAQSNRRAAATGIVHWAQRAARTGRSAQLGAHAGPSNRLLAQHSQVLRCVWRLYEVIAEQNDPESFSLVSLTLASENPTPPTRDVESWPRHSSPPSDAVSTPLALQSPALPERALRITVAQDTLRVLFTVPAGLTHRLGARELKRGCPASQVYSCPQEQKARAAGAKARAAPRRDRTKCPW